MAYMDFVSLKEFNNVVFHGFTQSLSQSHHFDVCDHSDTSEVLVFNVLCGSEFLTELGLAAR